MLPSASAAAIVIQRYDIIAFHEYVISPDSGAFAAVTMLAFAVSTTQRIVYISFTSLANFRMFGVSFVTVAVAFFHLPRSTSQLFHP